MADGWDLFGGAPSDTHAEVHAAVQAAAPAGDGWAAFGGAPDSEAARAAPVAGPQPSNVKTGAIANAAAGAVEGAADTINVAADPFGNLIGRPLAAVGATVHDALAPVFGYQKFTPEARAALLGDDAPQIGNRIVNAVGDAMGAPSLEDVRPSGLGQELLRSGARGAAGMAALGAGQALPQIALGAAAGAAGGVTGDIAQTLAPDTYKPVAGLAGGLLGAGAVAGTAAAGRTGWNSLVDLAAPLTERRNALLDGAGAPFTTPEGAAINATPQQARDAGNQLLSVTHDPVAVQNALMTPTVPTAATGPMTTAQLTRDPGLAMQEYRISRSGSPLDQAAFKARQDQQNDARVGALGQVATEGSPDAVSTAAQSIADQARVAGEAKIAQAQADAAASTAAAATQADVPVQAAQQTASRALEAIGGDLPSGSDATVGQMLRQPIAESLAQTRAREGALWDAIDPDGTLGVDMTPIRGQAQQIMRDVGPNAAPLAGEEGAIFNTAAGLPDVQSFRDLTDLRSRLTGQIRAARVAGSDQEVRRLSMLLDGVHDAMEGTVAGKAAADNVAVQAGQMAPEQTTHSRVTAWQQEWYDRQRAAATDQAQVGTGTAGRDAFGGSGGVSSIRSGSSPSGRGSGGASAAQSLPSQPELTPNFDAAAQQRYADARQATADRVATYKSAPGVGQVLQKGPTAGSFRTPDSGVPNVIVKVGPQGADAAKAYLAAGGSPEALNTAAAFSLRQAAMKPDGTLDPARFQSWARARSSFLSQIPDAAARFGAAADAQQAATATAKTAGQSLKDATAVAQKTVDDAMASHAQLQRQIQTSVLGKFLGDADPVERVGSILRDKAMGEANMGRLAQAVKGNPAATAGLQRAVAEYVQREMVGNTKGITSESGNIRADRFQTFLRAAEPALSKALTPAQMQGLRNVASSLEQTNFSSQVGVGSPTAQLVAGRGNTLLSKIGRELAGYGTGAGAGGSLGFAVAGPAGSAVGGLLGGAVGKVVQAAREAGIENVEHLKTQALLNPELFRVLTTKTTPANEPMLMAQFAGVMRRASLVGAVQQTAPAPRQPEPRRNALLH